MNIRILLAIREEWLIHRSGHTWEMGAQPKKPSRPGMTGTYIRPAVVVPRRSSSSSVPARARRNASPCQLPVHLRPQSPWLTVGTRVRRARRSGCYLLTEKTRVRQSRMPLMIRPAIAPKPAKLAPDRPAHTGWPGSLRFRLSYAGGFRFRSSAPTHTLDRRWLP